MKPMSRMRGLWSTLAAILLIMGCRPATSRESSAASPDAPPTSQVTEEASGQPSQDSTGPLEWKDAGVGSPQQAGRHTWDRKTLTLSGTGAGLDVKGQDQVQFAYLSGRSGDFEIVGRLVDISGEGDAAAGIMVRQDSAANGAMAALHYTSQGQKLGWKSRVPGKSSGETSRVFSGGIALARQAPLWLKMVRVGPNLAVYKSRDGELWTMISNVSGGPIALEGPFDLGFFATSSGDGKPVTATFDSIRIGPARLRYRTSWVGNTFGCRADDNHVSNGLSAMWVSPDGTCYTSSYWDEAGQPVTSYRDGKVLRALPIGTPQTAEGGITGDARHVYVAAVDRIIALDPAAPDFAPRPLVLSVNLLDKKANQCVVSGMASNGRELFVADSRENLIRVVTVEPVPSFHVAGAANDGVVNAPAPVVVPKNDPRFAPASVYQSQRIGEGNRYTIPGLVAGSTYTVRCHFAEYVDRPANCDPRNRFVSVESEEIHVAERAGGILKALVHDFPNRTANEKGEVVFSYGAYGGPGLCGFEILGSKGEQVFAVNCGGPPVGDFKGESPELLARNFPFERPGPMTIDARGDLWIIQRGNDFPIGVGTIAKYPAAIKCCKTDGTFTGRAITDVVNPRAVAYDSASDQLLVAENGPDLNLRIYTGLTTAPTLARTFGAKGGIYSGATPGRVHDPDAGGWARFAGVSGVGVDAQGNLYVGGGFQGSDLRQFGADVSLRWMLHSLVFCNTYDVDPDSDGTEIYAPYNHVQLDLSRSEPGQEQKYVGYNWDLRRFGEPARAGGSQAIVRRAGAERRLIMVTTGQGAIDDVRIYRYDGEIAIPAGRVGANEIWIDSSGDGKEQPGEITPMAPSLTITGVCVDSRSDLWVASSGTDGSFMRHFKFQGLDPHGVPIYSAAKGGGYEDVRFPEEGGTVSAWGMGCRLDYDAARDIMVVLYPAVARKGESDKSAPQYFLARYDNWSRGNRAPKWKFKALRPETDPDFFMYEKDLFPYSFYSNMQIAGRYLFMAFIFGEIHAFDLDTGKLVEILSMGPEVNGQSAWEDAAMGLRVFRRNNGEYLIFTENSGWGGKNNFFRWKPE